MEIWDKLQLHKTGNLSYKDGVALFFTIHPNKTTLKSFFEFEDKYSRKKLKTALDQKYQELEANHSATKFQSFVPSVHQAKPINLSILPPDLRFEYGKLGPIIREISSLHARLFNCTTNEQRHDLAKRIYTLVNQRRLIFIKIDGFVATGTIPTQKPTLQLRVNPGAAKNFELEYKLKLLRSRKVKLSKNPRRIDEFNAVVAQINQLLQDRNKL